MELPFEKTVCRYWKQKLYEMREVEETQELRVSDGMPDVARVIAAWGQPILRSKEWRDRSLGISGGVMVWVMYAGEGEETPQRMETWIPFQTRIDMSASNADGVIRVEPVLTGVDARITSSRKLMIRAGIGLIVQALEPEETDIYAPGQMPEDMELLRSSYPLSLIEEAGEKTFTIDEELELPGAMPAVDSIIYFRLLPELADQKVMGSKAVFRGYGNLHLLYRSEDGKLYGYDFQVPFAQYIDLNGDYDPEARISNLFCVTNLELDAVDGKLQLKCGMVSQYTVSALTVLDLVEDAYSPCRDVQLQRQEVSLPIQLDNRNMNFDLSQTVEGQEDTPLDNSFFCQMPRISRQGDQVQLEVGGVFQSLLEQRDGQLTGKAVKANQQMELASHCGNDTISFPAIRADTGCRKEGGSWRVDTQVVLDLGSLCDQNLNMVRGMELGQERSPEAERPSVIIRACRKNERLWDLAKRCGSTVSAIARMNHLEGDPEEEQLLVIPVI